MQTTIPCLEKLKLATRLRFLLDTNVFIPLQDTMKVLEYSLANLVRLAHVGGHLLMYHPATISDFARDKNQERKNKNLERIQQFSELENPPHCPWNDSKISANEACDNELIYALVCDAIHALITEDKGIHAKARKLGLEDRVYTIQTAEDWLKRLHETNQVTLPNIEEVSLFQLTPELDYAFFDSLRSGYPKTGERQGFDDWFRKKAREGRRAWTYRDENNVLAAICIFQVQENETVNDSGEVLTGAALKLCTFKVGETVRGRKIGELFLKAAFRYATDNLCEHLFITTNYEKHQYLVNMLEDFGFSQQGIHHGDCVYVKPHPILKPKINDLSAYEFNRKYFPHFRSDSGIQKFIVPIKPQYHEILFPDYQSKQSKLFASMSNIGNAIKLAYLCHAPTNAIKPGDILLFYRSEDEKALTSVGVVEDFKVSRDITEIVSLVSRRTVYSFREIEKMAEQPTKIILFRLIKHFKNPISHKTIERNNISSGPILSIRKVSDASFSKIFSIVD